MLKIGDIVRVKTKEELEAEGLLDEANAFYDGPYPHGEMWEFAGRECTVGCDLEEHRNWVDLEEDYGEWAWPEFALVLIGEDVDNV